MTRRIYSTDPRKVRALWEAFGGHVLQVRRTGELRWVHPAFESSVRANARRNDIPAAVLCRLNHLIGDGGKRELQ
jgi:hypothetical protein